MCNDVHIKLGMQRVWMYYIDIVLPVTVYISVLHIGRVCSSLFRGKACTTAKHVVYTKGMFPVNSFTKVKVYLYIPLASSPEDLGTRLYIPYCL